LAGISAVCRGSSLSPSAPPGSRHVRRRRDRPAPRRAQRTPTTTSALLIMRRHPPPRRALRGHGRLAQGRCPSRLDRPRGLAWVPVPRSRPALHWGPPAASPRPSRAGRQPLRRPSTPPRFGVRPHVGSWCSGRSPPGAGRSPGRVRSDRRVPGPLGSSRGALRAFAPFQACARRPAPRRDGPRAPQRLPGCGDWRRFGCAPEANQLTKRDHNVGRWQVAAGARVAGMQPVRRLGSTP